MTRSDKKRGGAAEEWGGEEEWGEEGDEEEVAALPEKGELD